VSAGLATFALGTETWGSILCPSAFCGLTGIRPTYGLVSRAGGMVGAYTFDKVGPLARSASDCRTVLAAIAGADPRDPSCATERTKLDRGAGRQWRNLHAALVPLDWKKVGEPEVKAAFDAAVAELSGAGLRMEETPLPDGPAAEVSGLLIGMEALAAFDPFIADGRVKQLVDDMAPRQLELGQLVTGPDTLKAIRIREAIQRQMREFFQRFDVIVTPNFMSVAPPVEQDLNEALPYGDPVGAFAAACGGYGQSRHARELPDRRRPIRGRHAPGPRRDVPDAHVVQPDASGHRLSQRGTGCLGMPQTFCRTKSPIKICSSRRQYQSGKPLNT
jgi:aspartyl-tRNA(Asn)/glutamyl-tRNA(Gln) amidotransferase subunit A